MMKFNAYILCAFLFLVGVSARAQQPQPDPIGENLFPPELLMQHQQAIGLTEELKNLIKTEVQKAQARFTELHWQLQNDVETMATLVKEQRADEQQVLTQLDKILNLEREIKRIQLALAIRIKNSLSIDQQIRLKEIIKNKIRIR